MEHLAIATTTIGFVLTLGWVIRTLAGYRKERHVADLQSQLHARALDRFQSPEEMRDYLNSDVGTAFLRSSRSERGKTQNTLRS